MGLGMSINCQSYTLLISAPNKEGSYTFSEILFKIMGKPVYHIQILHKSIKEFHFYFNRFSQDFRQEQPTQP